MTDRNKANEKKDGADETIEQLPTRQEDIEVDEQVIIDTVSAHLLKPAHDVRLCIDHSNHKAKAVQESAYAKISGKDWTFFVKTQTTLIGRPPEDHDSPAGESAVTPSHTKEKVGPLGDSLTDTPRVQMDLGPSKVVSRQHAEIRYNGEEKLQGWFLIVNGRNGAKLNGTHINRGRSAKLNSGSVIEIAGLEMLFILPEGDDKLVIHPPYLRRAGLIAGAPDDQDQIDFEAGHDGQRSSLPPQHGHPQLAPAPPDYRRPDTPVRQRGRGPPSSTPRGNALTFVDSENADYSLEANSHMKPGFTYSQLISQAILSTGNQKATLATIYDYVKDKYAFYRRPGTEKGWQNSIRHNLSLNSGFELEPRETHEPGKGGYWIFTKDKRQELIEEAWGKMKKTPAKKSSSPNSPDTKPRRSVHGPGDVNGGSPVRKIKRSPPPSNSPDLAYARKPQYTPDQGRYGSSLREDPLGDGSPLPRRRQNTNVYGFSDNIQGSPPILSSSYANEDGGSFITPAPQRKRPYLAPPSTAQRPSQHMPTSSPAPFWRYADLGGVTPMRPFDMSPIKNGPEIQSSSPPRPDANGSPSRVNGEAKADIGLVEDEEPAFDLSK